ncbi:msx2-interacting protein [Denticeps clupeoides]|uniref:Msx2-interacting protein n=1 Tax=Denticeps clupeoides TaxID=299321 RepID=A0AAY4B5M4_9TELE|nr:msx2-interacting protein [Denticeps clupeoides]
MVRETRHLWVGNLPENVREEKIVEHFKRYGRVESVKVLPKRGSEGGVAAFVDFVDIKSAQKAHNSVNKMGDRDLRTDYNEPGTIPSAARGLDDSLPLGTRAREVSGFTRGAGGPVYGPSAALHSREGRYERRLDGAGESRERAYDHSAYGHHDRSGGGGGSSSGSSTSFERQRHYDTDYYRDPRDRALGGGGAGTVSTGGSSGGSLGGVTGTAGVAATVSGGSSGSGGGGGGCGGGLSTSVGAGYYGSRSRSPSRFESAESRYEARAGREPFTLASVVHRDLYREDRGRRGDRPYHHSRSRSPHPHSHNPSPQTLANQTTRPPRSPSGSGSHSRSSSSDSVSSSSSSSGSDSSSSSSDESPARSVQSTAVPAPSAQPLPILDKDEPRKSFGIKVQNLPVRSTDTSLKDGLFHEFKKHGKVTSVQIHGASEERYGLVFFRQQEDQEKALSASKGKLFFGMQIEVTAWNGPETESENEFRPLDERIDEFHPKATRTLFIGNLEKTTSYHDLLNIFQRFGEIVDIDIKKVNGAPQYAFLQYCDIASVCKAIKKMDGEYLGNNRLKLGFGKSMPTTCVWLDGLSSSITEQYLTRHFCRYGHVVKVVFDRLKGMALILYNNIECAQAAVKETKGWKIGGNKIKVDFANQESQMAFYRSMQASGQDIRDFYDILSERREERRPPYHEFSAERAYYENIRTPGSYTDDARRKYPPRTREFYTEWDPYQGDYYDPRYYEDPREYRDYRDAYEQDIRKYSYLQRERERERERFEMDRERDHGRRTLEHSQSPSIPRRPTSPKTSPSPSDHLPSDSEHHLFSRSSERSGSCSSMSPPCYEKPDKVRPDRYSKCDKTEKERPVFEGERASAVEKEKRAGRKEKGEKDRGEKQKIKKLKLPSPTVPSSETDPEPDKETSPEVVQSGKSTKLLNKDKDGKGRLDILPCVVQLTRVKEKEAKVVEHVVLEKQRLKCGTESVRSPPLLSSSDQRSVSSRVELHKGDILWHGKVIKEKGLASQVELVDKDSKVRSKKPLKSDPGFETTCSTVDIDRLAARKRRFEEATGKTDMKRINQEEDDCKLGLKRLVDVAKDIEADKKMLRKDAHRRDHQRAKPERSINICCPSDRQDSESISSGQDINNSVDLQSHHGEAAEESTDHLDHADQKSNGLSWRSPPTLSRNVSSDCSQSSEQFTEHVRPRLIDPTDLSAVDRSSNENQERLFMDIDHSQSCRKQMEQNRKFQKQFQRYDKPEKSESPRADSDYLERRSLVHEVGKPPQDVTDDSPSTKRKKFEAFDLDQNLKRERNYRSSRPTVEDDDRSVASTTTPWHFPFSEEESTIDSPIIMAPRDLKHSQMPDDNKASSHLDCLKYFNVSNIRKGPTHTQHPKLKSLCDDEEVRWETRMKLDTQRVDTSFPSSIVKHDGLRKRPEHELEPGEVQSDSDDDDENKHQSPKPNTSLAYLQRDREERLLDLKLSGSLEKNKFYEFALDKTITPDTKNLLERAKSLFSSREDNWSFLGHDSRLTNFQNSMDKEKVEPTPLPIPSWYKRKCKPDSEGKIDDKKEELKAEQHERQERFVSRFLRSSIFEQDSRRLQHIGRKDQEPDLAKQIGRTSVPEVSLGPVCVNNLQEPMMLFRSRFLELQQQKDRDHRPHDSEKINMSAGSEGDKVTEPDMEGFPKMPELMHEPKSISPVPAQTCPIVSAMKETLLHITSSSAATVKDEDVERTQISPVWPRTSEMTGPLPLTVKSMPESLPKEQDCEQEFKHEPKEESLEVKVVPGNTLNVEAFTFNVKPPTPGASLNSLEIKLEPEAVSPVKVESQNVFIEEETQPESFVNHSAKNAEGPLEMLGPVSEAEAETTPPIRKQPKNKKCKSVSQASPPTQTFCNEKPATRKSERIDREKLKRASSPRGEVARTSVDARSTAKSPVQVMDAEQGPESNTPFGRTRRRNVRSVYATPPDCEAPQQSGREAAEPTRSTRKRGVDKEHPQQDANPPIVRRGRPPKSRKCGKGNEDSSLLKCGQPKLSESEDTDSKESGSSGDIPKVNEGWRSPRTQKSQPSPPRISLIRKANKTEKLSEIPVSQAERIDVAEEPLDISGKLLEENAKHQTGTQKREKEKKCTETVDKNSSREHSEEKLELLEKRLPSEKGGKTKASRFTRNTKIGGEDKSLSLKNLVIHLSVDDVKGVLQSEDGNPEAFDSVIKKNKSDFSNKEDTRTTSFLKEVDDLCPGEKEEFLESECATDPAATLLARQMELERAVENIAKLTVEQTAQPYKDPPAEQAPLTSPVPVEPEADTEEEKPANPSSETELAAAIDSITAEDISADADGFNTAPTYTALLPTPESVLLPSTSESAVPETHIGIGNIIETNAAVSLVSNPKPADPDNIEDLAQGEPLPPETPKKGSKARPKTPKKSRGRKICVSRKAEPAEEAVFEAEPTAVKLPESIPEDSETVNTKAAMTSAAAIITPPAVCKHESAVALDTPKEAEQPAVEQPEPQESAFHSSSNSPSHFKAHQPPTEPTGPSLTSSPTQMNGLPVQPGKMAALQSTRLNRSTEEVTVHPPPQITVAAPPPAAVPGIGNTSGNPPLPPDTKASDVDPSSSTLRKILMEPKYVPASNSNAVHNTMLTTTLGEPRVSENESFSEPSPAKHSLTEDRPSSLSVHPQTATAQIRDVKPVLGEKVVNSVISSTTSVISRIPMPFDLDETPHISLSNRSAGIAFQMQKYRSGVNENNLPRYSGLTIAEEGSVGRPGADSAHYNMGSRPGLRVNTSEGVVVLSCSGQKTEGPQRISAKISQIPPASAVDIEFQQSVSKSQMKQELLTPSQPSIPKGSQTATSYGHAGVILPGQPYNTQPVISSIGQGSPSSDKSESPYHAGPQGGPVKMFQQSNSSSQVLMYSHVVMAQHVKKGQDSILVKGDASKVIQPNVSPVLTSHLPSLGVNHISSSPTTPTDRHVQHPKQDPHSPRPSGLSPSPFPKGCTAGSSMSPIGTSVVLGPSGPISPYVSSVNHAEQSVIMPPHSVTQSVAIGHHPPGDVRLNTPPLPGISYGMRAESLASPRSGAHQRATTPQPTAIREMVLQSHGGAPGPGTGSGASEEEMRHFHSGLRRPSAPHLQSEVMVVPGDFRVPHGGLRLDQYNSRDVRILMHHQMGEHPVVDSHQSRTPEATTMQSHYSVSSKTPPIGKGAPPPGKEIPKTVDIKMASSPHRESRIISHPSVPVMMPPQGVQIIRPGSTSAISEYSAVYRDIRSFHSQFPTHSAMGINLASRATPSSQGPQEMDHSHRSKVGLVQTSGKAAAVEPKCEISHLRHLTMEMPHMARIQVDTGTPSYTTAIAHKAEIPLAKPSASSIQMRPEVKPEHTEHHPVDMVQLLTRYPIVWQGLLALKNDTAAVQLHFVSGNNILAQCSLPPVEGGPLLRIAQRMRLEATQLEGVARRMTIESDYCLLLALPCGRDQDDVLSQTQALKGGFITYLQSKQAAGIINVPNPGSNQPAYVVQIFPPCEFSESHLSHLAPDLLRSISSISPHLMIVIASV